MSKPCLVFWLIAGCTLLSAQTNSGWHLVWSDEFNGAANTPPDPTKWNFDLGGGGWGNGEQEVYTNSVNNAFQDGKGNLVIRAIKDAGGNFTSARLLTGIDNASDAVNLNWQYGKIEARIKLPFGPGVWPAFWMLGSNYSTVSWPDCGEIDILENFGPGGGDDASTVHGTIHGPNFADAGVGAPYHLPNQEKFTDDYHLFSIEWSANSVHFFVDGTDYEPLTPASLPTGGQWVFNQPFFLILNLAIGGPTTFLGTPQPDTPFPQDVLIDYVRVYAAVTLPPAQPGISPGGILNAASGLGSIAPGSLVSVYGVNLADATYASLFENGEFVTSTPSGVSVNVNGKNAPLTYISPSQINFQLPWETPLAPQTVNVAVTWNGSTSEAEAVTVTPTSPSVFLDPSTGAALSSTDQNVGILYGNGFGPATTAVADGAPNVGAAPTANACSLTIGGVPATVNYCGAAPGEIIDQLNFQYPAGATSGAAPVVATLTINGVTGTFLIQIP
jgi:uncharacterized protein (TIGR03437 family)